MGSRRRKADNLTLGRLEPIARDLPRGAAPGSVVLSGSSNLPYPVNRFVRRHLEVMPPSTNRGPLVYLAAGSGLGGRMPAGGSCRDEVVAALHALRARTGTQVFTVRDVYSDVVAAGAGYAESTVFKTMQRMKETPKRPPTVQLELAEPDGSGSSTRTSIDSVRLRGGRRHATPLR